MSIDNLSSVQLGYTCSSENRADIEADLTIAVANQSDHEFNAVVLKSPQVDGYFGSIGRSLEVERGFREMPEDMQGLEYNSRFIYMVDKGPGNRSQVVHSMRFLQADPENPYEVVGDLMNDLKDQVTLEEAAAYHDIRDPVQCMYVTTDLSTPGVLPTRTKPYGLLVYKTLFKYGKEQNITHTVAYMNTKTLRGMGRLGIIPEPLCGRSNYVIPPTGDMTFEQYQPYVLHAAELSAFYDPERAKLSRWGRMLLDINVPRIELSD